ncbi:MAG: tRNA (adenosine(37)-N6)-threonylcarbamoyltransferase complex transferase subunit TsaD [Polyangiaceae bacterium]|nr:tRNA (adenosine(37)-N6)-threonylcarbamoyltransferase complex transferase subunit TsaD [Polyangiaceae bacterium]
MLILGVESSCDETAAAVVTEGGRVLADVVHSQVHVHGPYGGVVPELAARDHLANVAPVVEAALAGAGVGLADLDGIAVTARPGLAGALLVGAQFAKTLAWVTGKPLVGVDHLMGHLLSVFLRREGDLPRPAFPYVGLLASGGHTAIYRVDGPLAANVRELGATRDDAAGEAFDKFAKLLGLGYPGGPAVDRLAARGNPAALPVPRPMSQGLEFSFSGLKTWVVRHLEDAGPPRDEAALADLCASFQAAAVDVLVKKALRAAALEGVPSLVLGGGVACNRGLRQRAAEACAERGVALFVPPPSNCTDNAAMIAYAGAMRLLAGERDGWSLETATRTSLPRATRKGRGARV